jgi:septal ring factor EnvC (AmiA/AmiB activator)
MTANHFIHVAEKFADKCTILLHLPATILYELASPSTHESIIEQVEQGQIAPTLEAIKEAKAALKWAQEAERQAQVNVETTQQRLFQVQQENTDLQQQITQLHDQLTAVPEPVIQIKEVNVPVIPPEVTTHVETLQHRLNDALQQRDQLSQRVAELGAQARSHLVDQNREARGQRMRQQWRHVTKELHQCGLQVLAQWPTAMDIEAFDQEEWIHLQQLQDITRLLLEACMKVGKETGHVVDADHLR